MTAKRAREDLWGLQAAAATPVENRDQDQSEQGFFVDAGTDVADQRRDEGDLFHRPDSQNAGPSLLEVGEARVDQPADADEHDGPDQAFDAIPARIPGENRQSR